MRRDFPASRYRAVNVSYDYFASFYLTKEGCSPFACCMHGVPPAQHRETPFQVPAGQSPETFIQN